jgi:hypothetical protein
LFARVMSVFFSLNISSDVFLDALKVFHWCFFVVKLHCLG